MFIIEGPDCAGKSTLCSLLSKALKLDIIHLNNKSDNSYKTYKNRISDMEKKPVIYDRFFFSEIVYAEVLGRKPVINQAEYMMLKEYLTFTNIQVIHCTNIYGKLLERYDERGENFVNKTQLLYIADAFHKEFRLFPVTEVQMNFNNLYSFMDVVQTHTDRFSETKITNE